MKTIFMRTQQIIERDYIFQVPDNVIPNEHYLENHQDFNKKVSLEKPTIIQEIDQNTLDAIVSQHGGIINIHEESETLQLESGV